MQIQRNYNAMTKCFITKQETASGSGSLRRFEPALVQSHPTKIGRACSGFLRAAMGTTVVSLWSARSVVLSEPLCHACLPKASLWDAPCFNYRALYWLESMIAAMVQKFLTERRNTCDGRFKIF